MKGRDSMKKPKYEELANSLLRKINRGVFSNGKLPAMSSIAREYGVNLQTANRAVKFLEQQGIVSCFAGKKGTVINAARATLSAAGNSGKHGFMVDQVFGSKMLHRIRFAHTYFNERMLACFNECARRFAQRYPWSEVEIITIDNFQRLENDEVPFDTALVIGRDIRHFIRQGKLLELDSFLRLSESSESDFYPGIWQNCRSGNDLYAVPFSWSVPLVSSREEFAAFSWEKPELIPHCPGSFNIGFYSLICLFMGEPSLQKNIREKRQSFLALLKFIKKLCVSPRGELTFWDNPAALREFDVKKNSFLCGYYSNINAVTGREKDWHYSALPSFPGGENILVNECLVINKKSGFVPESLLWLKFLQSTEAQEIFMDEPFFLPIRNSMLKTLAPELLECIAQAAENAVLPRLSSSGLYRLYGCVYPVLARCFSGEINEDSAVDAVMEALHEQIVLDNL